MKQAGEIREVEVGSLVPHPANYRKHPPRQVRNLAESLEKHGQYRTVVVQAGTNRILAGHGVVEAAKQRGEQTVLANVIECDDGEALQILVDDNKLAENSKDDNDALIAVVRELAGTENEPLAFEQHEMAELLREIVAEVEEPAYPICAVFDEQYNYVLILSTTKMDWMWLQSQLQLREERDPHKNYIQLSRVLTMERFRELWDAR